MSAVFTEIDEYIVTDAIASHYVEILERYDGTFNHEHEGIAIWISGFFGSGKSSFAKNLGLAIEDRAIGGRRASERCSPAAASRSRTRWTRGSAGAGTPRRCCGRCWNGPTRTRR